MVMDGTKTQTRRLVDMGRLSVDIPVTVTSDLPGIIPLRVAKPGRHRVRLNPHGAVTCLPMELGLKPGGFHFRCPLVDGTTHLADLGNDKKVWTITPVGEQRLWVKETWGLHSHGDETDWFHGSVRGIQAESLRAQFALALRADWGPLQEGCFWRPGIFMPRWASRTNLIVIQARLMRLHDITVDDARAEGVTSGLISADDDGPVRIGYVYGHDDGRCALYPSEREAFAAQWASLHADGRRHDPVLWDRNPSVSTNPWVWAYTFRREAL
jgi:hypothetical protein